MPRPEPFADRWELFEEAQSNDSQFVIQQRQVLDLILKVAEKVVGLYHWKLHMSNFRRNLRRILYTESVDVSYVENCVTYIEKNSS